MCGKACLWRTESKCGPRWAAAVCAATQHRWYSLLVLQKCRAAEGHVWVQVRQGGRENRMGEGIAALQVP